MDYARGDTCPRCDAEERHKEILSATEESLAETVEAMRESDYRRTNPGDHACPHCKYISLKNEASRCPLCRGEIGGDYWNAVRAKEKVDTEAAAERKRAIEAATTAEHIRTAPARAAAASAERKRAHDAAVRSAVLGVFLILGFGCVVGLIASVIVGLIAGWVLKSDGGIAALVTFIGCLAFIWWRITVEQLRPYRDGEAKRRKEDGGG